MNTPTRNTPRKPPHSLISVDPGLRVCGIAEFNNIGLLVWAELLKNPERKARGPEAWFALADVASATITWGLSRPLTYACEVPQVYRGPKGKGDPADLIEIAGVAAAIGCRLLPAEAFGYAPRQWKGQVPKEVMCRRIESRLSPEEVEAIEKCAPSLRHNVLDAIGIGLFHLGRL